MPQYSGTSERTHNFEQALALAIDRARGDLGLGGTAGTLTFRVVSVTGVHGGGKTALTVTIEADAALPK